MTIKNLVRVHSSFVVSIGYKDGIATVRFASGKVTDYPMPVAKWQQWMASPSQGKFFNQFVRGKRSRNSRLNVIAGAPRRIPRANAQERMAG